MTEPDQKLRELLHRYEVKLQAQRAQLGEAQAQCVALREALERSDPCGGYNNHTWENGTCTTCWMTAVQAEALVAALAALATPCDRTELDALLAAERAKSRGHLQTIQGLEATVYGQQTVIAAAQAQCMALREALIRLDRERMSAADCFIVERALAVVA